MRARRASVLPRPSPSWLLLDAARRWREGERAPCRLTFTDVLGADPLGPLEPWGQAAYLCAAGAQELAVAEQMAPRLPTLPALPAARHAWLLLEQDRVKDALVVLDRAGQAALDPDEARALVDARLAAHGRTGSWEALAKLAKEGGSPELRLQVADALQRVGRAADARAIRALACAELPPATPACK